MLVPEKYGLVLKFFEVVMEFHGNYVKHTSSTFGKYRAVFVSA